jgi:protocatechuate 3,4-dioxygenase alpha subunit
MEKKLETPSQTVGPYFAYGLCPQQYNYDFKSLADNMMVHPLDEPDAITISGTVYDGDGNPIPDAMVELWQDDGKVQLFGRYGTGTDDQNRFIFYTKKPQPAEGQAPNITVILFMRGQLIHSYTRIYFSDEAELNEKDEILNCVPANRQSTLIARKGNHGYIFDIHMQGEYETVFFDI